MERLIVGTILGIAAAIWTLAFVWASRHPYAQALMIFIAIVSAVRALTATETRDELQELNRD